MTGAPNPKDLQTLQNGLVDGLITPDNLPGGVRDMLYQYMGQQGINMNDPQSQITQAQLNALRQQREAQEGSIFDSKIFKPIEWVGSKMYEAYSASVSPAVSFLGFQINKWGNFVGGSYDANQAANGDLSLSDEWELAHHISPGQSIWRSFMSTGQLEKAGLTEKEMLKQEREVSKGTFKGVVSADDPFGTKTNLDKYFSSGPSKYVTGALDFGVSWYSDPLVLGGKAYAVGKAAKFTRNVSEGIEAERLNVMKANPTLTDKAANEMAWTNFTTKQPFQKLTDHFWDMKTKNADTFAAQALREPTLAKSANGPAVAKLLAQATTKDEMVDVLRTTMGDVGAREALKVKNAQLSYQIEQLNARQASVNNYFNGLPDAQKVSPFGLRVKALMDKQSQDMARLDRDTQVVSDRLKGYGLLGEMNFNSITTPVGTKIRNAWQTSRDWTPFENGGFIKARVNNAYNLSLGGMIKIAHTYNDIRSARHIDIHDVDSWRQVNANLMDAKHLTQQARDMYTSRYLNAAENDRPAVLQSIEQDVVHSMVDNYNLKRGLTGTPDEISYDVANRLYKEVADRRSSAQAGMQREMYGTAQVDNPDLPGTKIQVDQVNPDGSKLVVAPLLRSQLANSHSMLDFKLFQNALDGNASFWQKAMNQHGDKWDKAVALADYVTHVWKFSALFRLGYGPRALADDFLGQVARFGPMDMISRSIAGGKYTWDTLKAAAHPSGQLEAALVARSHLEHQIDDLVSKQGELQSRLERAKAAGQPTSFSPPAGVLGPSYSMEDLLKSNQDRLSDLRRTHADMDSIVKGGAAYKAAKQGGQLFDPAYAGVEGALFRDFASGEKNFQNMMGSGADGLLNTLRRMNWEALDATRHGEGVHMDEWLKVLNQQVANDQLAVKYLKGESPEKLENWLATPEGSAYKRGHRIANLLPHDQLVDRITSQIDEWANPAFPAGDAIRQAASRGEVTREMLEGVPISARPLVHGQAMSIARGSHDAMLIIDNLMNKWYHLMGNMPNRHLLRNPLFAQRYNVHLGEMMTASSMRDQRMTEDLRQAMQSAARQRALRDVKKNTFTMDYETKMSYMMKNFGAFFGAQQESWNRWARIISDKPDVGFRVAQVYGAPTRAGLVTDSNGQKLNADGTVTDPMTGNKRLVPYNERHIVIQVPDYLGGKALAKFLGSGGKVARIDPKTGKPVRDSKGHVIYDQENAILDIPMSTANIILNHGDGPLPVSAGPYVQLAANHFGKDHPEAADVMTKLGLLPFGPQNSSAFDAFLPNWYRKINQTDDLGNAKQSMMWYIMQAENYKYSEGLRKNPPTWKEIGQRADNMMSMKAWFAFTLPISVSTQDPYQFFRDQHRAMVQAVGGNTMVADQMFYDKFGDSAFVFAQSLSKNNAGLRPTVNGVKMSQHYQDLIAKVGEKYAGLIVGDEGEGTYSQGAYFYQKTHATDPSAGHTERSMMSPQEALKAANLSKGWQQYKAMMNDTYAKLYAAGFTSFDDPGAEALKREKQAVVKVLGDPQTLDDNGNLVNNPYYNAEWSEAYNSLDVNYYDRQARDFKQIVNDPELWAKAEIGHGAVGRSDIYWLKTYLNYRDDAKRALVMRDLAGGSADINAKENIDIKTAWNSMVVQMIQKSIGFGNLFHRYLSRDMGFDQATVTEQQQTGTLPAFAGDIEDQSAEQSPFDYMAENGSIGGFSTGGFSSGGGFSAGNKFGG